jgi:aspartate aminotransferase
MKLSKNVTAMQFSPIRRFNGYAADAKKAGKKVYHLNIGQPDIVTPPEFMEAVRNFDENVLEYAESGGDTRLVNSVIGYFSRLGVTLAPEDILVTNGGSEALQMIFTSILDKDDEVMMAEPFYTNYHAFISAASGKIAPITTSPEDGYFYADSAKLEAAYNERCKAIAIVNPGNPTGCILSKEDMKVICDFAVKHDLWIVADEVYREFVYDGKEMSTFASFDEIADRLVIADSVSKRFSACGARVGFAITKNKELQDGLMKIAQGRLCCPTLEMMGAASLYELPGEYFNATRKEYEERRDCVYDGLMKIPGIVCQKPGGAFYIMAKLPVESAEDFLMWLLTEFDDNGETVMYAPAEGFYATPGLGKNEIRIAYILNQKDLARAVELIRIGIEKYKAEGYK